MEVDGASNTEVNRRHLEPDAAPIATAGGAGQAGGQANAGQQQPALEAQRDVVAGANAVNETRGRAATELLGSAQGSARTEPALPGAATTAAANNPRAQQIERARESVRQTMQGEGWKTPEGARAAAHNIRQAVQGLNDTAKEAVLRETMGPLSQHITDPKNGSREDRLAVAHEMAPVMSQENIRSVTMTAREGGTTTREQAAAFLTLDRARTDNVVPENRRVAGSASSNIPMTHNLQPLRDMFRGLRDGARDSVLGVGGGIKTMVTTAAKLMTDPKFQAAAYQAGKALAQQVSTEEGRAQLMKGASTAARAAGNELARRIADNPAYAAGYAIGAMAAGGAASRVLNVGGRVAGAAGAAATAKRSLAATAFAVAGTAVRHAASLVRAGMQNLKQQVEQQRQQLEERRREWDQRRLQPG